MKVVQAITGINQEASGTSYALPKLCAGLLSNGVEVEIHKIGSQRCHDFDFPVYGYPAHRWPFRTIWRSPEMYHGLQKACRSADVLHSNTLWAMPTVYPGWVKHRQKIKLVVSPHGSLAPWALRKGKLKKKIFGLLFQNQVLRRADMFHATSEKEYEEIRAAGYRQPVAIVPIGMDLPDVEPRNARKARNGEKGRRVVFFGRLHKVKGVDRLVRAWEQVVREGWELVIAGPDCGMLEELKSIVAERKLPRVSFVGEINGHAKYDFLADADIYVLPSDTENFGITVAESLASGTPVIASQGTPWEGLEHEKCGRWVPIGVEPLVAALKEMMSLDDTERAAMGECGKEWIRRDFAWEGIGAKMKASYEWLLGRGDRPKWIRLG